MSLGEWRDLPETSGATARIDTFVAQALGLGRAQVKSLFEEGLVRIDGKRARKGDRVEPGQRVSVRAAAPTEPPRERTAAPDPGLPLTLLYEDDTLLFVDKPSGIPSHPLRADETGTVANALAARFPECLTASEDPREAGLCHRLDIETSGVLLAARSRAGWTAIRAQFDERTVDKRYWALVTGPIADEGEIELPLRHHPRHADRVEPTTLGDGREARSTFQVIAESGELSLVDVRIFTGVLHQVRAHLAAIGAPVVGDELYGGRAEPVLGRFFLHARRLTVEHPETRKPVVVQSPLPPALAAILSVHQIPIP